MGTSRWPVTIPFATRPGQHFSAHLFLRHLQRFSTSKTTRSHHSLGLPAVYHKPWPTLTAHHRPGLLYAAVNKPRLHQIRIDRVPRTYPANMSDNESPSAVSTTPSDNNEPTIHQPIPTRPRLPSRQSSGPLVVPRDSSAVGPVESHYGPDDVRAMSPRRTSEDIDKMGKEAREELRKHAQALQDSLLTIFNRIEAVREEHDKLDSNNKFLQKYIGDLMSTGKITATSSRSKK